MRQLFLSWEGGGFRFTARKHFLMVPASMLGVTLNAIFLPTFFAKMLEEKLKKPLVLTNLVTEKAPNRHKNRQNRLF